MKNICKLSDFAACRPGKEVNILSIDVKGVYAGEELIQTCSCPEHPNTFNIPVIVPVGRDKKIIRSGIRDTGYIISEEISQSQQSFDHYQSIIWEQIKHENLKTKKERMQDRLSETA